MGGGAIRTAAKAAAFAGYRSTAARRAANLQPSAGLSTVHVAIEGESSPLISSVSSDKPAGYPAVAQRPAWEIDDWELAGGKEEEELAAMAVSDRIWDQPPRLVFGPAPTLEEATEATADLKEAIEKAYFSPGTTENLDKVNQASDLGKTTAILPSMPIHVVQAFSLLQGSPEAQSVVASLASDKNVWDAVMNNDKVMEFYNKHQSVSAPAESDIAQKEFAEENESLEGSSATVESPDKETSFFNDVVQNVRVKAQNVRAKVSEMVSNISVFLHDFLGASSSEGQGAAKARTDTSFSEKYVDFAMGASFVALAVAAILVILLKRG